MVFGGLGDEIRGLNEDLKEARAENERLRATIKSLKIRHGWQLKAARKEMYYLCVRLLTQRALTDALKTLLKSTSIRSLLARRK